MRGDLRALIDYIGLSIGEAAALIGVGHDALSKKLSGKPRYDVRQAEIDALAEVAAWQDMQVARCLALIERLRREHPATNQGVVLLSHQKTDDVLPDDLYSASVTRMINARIKAASPLDTHIVMFDRADYDAWRGGAPDTRAARQDWAIRRSVTGGPTRLSAKVGVKTDSNSAQMAIGWALWRVGNPAPTLIKRGFEHLAGADADASPKMRKAPPPA